MRGDIGFNLYSCPQLDKKIALKSDLKNIKELVTITLLFETHFTLS